MAIRLPTTAPWFLFACVVGTIAYVLLGSLSSGGPYYSCFREVGDGALGRGLVWIPVSAIVFVLVLVGLLGLFYGVGWLHGIGFMMLTVLLGLSTIAGHHCYVEWRKNVLEAFEGDVLVFERPVTDTAQLFRDLGEDARGCSLGHKRGADVLYVVGHVAGLDPCRARRVSETLRSKGYNVRHEHPKHDDAE